MCTLKVHFKIHLKDFYHAGGDEGGERWGAPTSRNELSNFSHSKYIIYTVAISAAGLSRVSRIAHVRKTGSAARTPEIRRTGVTIRRVHSASRAYATINPK